MEQAAMEKVRHKRFRLRTYKTLNFIRPSTQNLSTGHRPAYSTVRNAYPDKAWIPSVVATTKTLRQPRLGLRSHVKLLGWLSVEGKMSGGSSSVNFDADLAFLLSTPRNGQIFMRQQDSARSSKGTAPWSYVSTVEVESTAKIIVRVAGILTLGSLLLGFLLPSNFPLDALDAVWMSLAAIAGVLLIFLGPRALHTTAKVGPDELVLSTTGFRVRLKLQSIESITKSNFPSGGYGYRFLGKGHRGFISGGPQVDIRLNDGREYTVSVKSEDDFLSAVATAKRSN